jgi:hypothetical protein
MEKKKKTKKPGAETKPRLIRFAPEMDAWLEQHAEANGYTSVQELMRHIVRVYRAQVEQQGKERAT